MFGLLDNLDDPKKQALLMMAFGLFGGAPRSNKNFGADLGHAGLLGLQGYAGAQEAQSRMGRDKEASEFRRMQIEQMRREQEKQQRFQGLLGQFQMPGNLTPNDDEGNPMPPAPQGFNREGFADAWEGVDPMAGLQYRAKLQSLTPTPELLTVPEGASVYDKRNPTKPLIQGAPKLPTGMRMGPNGPEAIPEYVAMQERFRAAGKPSIDLKVNSYMPASEEAQKDFIKSSRATYDQLKHAKPALESIEKAKGLVPQAKAFMGPGSSPLLWGAKFMNNRLGMDINTEGVRSAEELRTRIFMNVMDNLKKMDAQPSQLQQKIMMEALGNLETDPNALPSVLDSYADVIRGKVEGYNQEVSSAIERGVKFPYDPIVRVPGAPQQAKRVRRYNPATGLIE